MRFTRFYIGLVIFLILAFGLFFYLIFNDTYVEGAYQNEKEKKIEEKGNLYDDHKLTVPKNIMM